VKLRIALLIVLLASVFGAASCSSSVTGDNRAADAAALQALDEQWSAAAAKNDVDATVAFYADDAVLLPSNAPIAKDAKAIRETWAGLLGPNTALTWKVSKAEVAKSGELGYLYGAYSLTIQDPKGGTPIRDTGKTLEIWKRQPDGEWKCIVDTYNSDLPLPPAPEAKK